MGFESSMLAGEKPAPSVFYNSETNMMETAYKVNL